MTTNAKTPASLETHRALVASLFPLTVLAATWLAMGDVSAAPTSDAGAAGQPALPACIQVKTEARYIPYGYNHIVTLTSGCSKLAACTVATDVNPQAQGVELPANGSVQITTFMGSASSTFVAKVSCQFR